jgi:hypothetical protein
VQPHHKRQRANAKRENIMSTVLDLLIGLGLKKDAFDSGLDQAEKKA